MTWPIFFTHILIILLLKISTDKIAGLISANGEPPYLNLVCDVGEIKRKTRVLVSQHRGYIFIQTDQPMYNPTQKGTTEITQTRTIHSAVCLIDTSSYQL